MKPRPLLPPLSLSAVLLLFCISVFLLYYITYSSLLLNESNLPIPPWTQIKDARAPFDFPPDKRGISLIFVVCYTPS